MMTMTSSVARPRRGPRDLPNSAGGQPGGTTCQPWGSGCHAAVGVGRSSATGGPGVADAGGSVGALSMDGVTGVPAGRWSSGRFMA